jgi:hypothetical protein
MGGAPRLDYGRGASAKTTDYISTRAERHEALQAASDLPMNGSAAV